MRFVRREDLADLAKLAVGIEQIMGGKPNGDLDTENLFCYFEPDFKIPVYSDSYGLIIGHFQWVDEIQEVVYVPAKKPRAPVVED